MPGAMTRSRRRKLTCGQCSPPRAIPPAWRTAVARSRRAKSGRRLRDPVAEGPRGAQGGNAARSSGQGEPASNSPALARTDSSPTQHRRAEAITPRATRRATVQAGMEPEGFADPTAPRAIRCDRRLQPEQADQLIHLLITQANRGDPAVRADSGRYLTLVRSQRTGAARMAVHLNDHRALIQKGIPTSSPSTRPVLESVLQELNRLVPPADSAQAPRGGEGNGAGAARKTNRALAGDHRRQGRRLMSGGSAADTPPTHRRGRVTDHRSAKSNPGTLPGGLTTRTIRPLGTSGDAICYNLAALRRTRRASYSDFGRHRPYDLPERSDVLTTTGLSIGLSLIVAMLICHPRTASGEVSPTTSCQDVALRAIPLGLVGGRLFHVADNWTYYGVHPLAVVEPGGFSLDGAILIGGLVAIATCVSATFRLCCFSMPLRPASSWQ